jgi:hypothetical protein
MNILIIQAGKGESSRHLKNLLHILDCLMNTLLITGFTSRSQFKSHDLWMTWTHKTAQVEEQSCGGRMARGGTISIPDKQKIHKPEADGLLRSSTIY